ncbi:hypothetical protein [Mesorhizobium sp.]|uniref:hypothetical protein n=1 Tax=Mesorhizobium sp. TaxID=1871066 RepID=UPI000FE99ABF|nr:hypothetical protein [Mesorhizobium sp.]RWN33414.1 MAG: hypothetical protein EOR95_15815 [Mesorhizobium sp.]
MDATELEGLIADVASGKRSQLVISDLDLDGLSGDDERRIGSVVRRLAEKGLATIELSAPCHHPASRTITGRKPFNPSP